MNPTRKSREHVTRAQKDSACKKGGYCLWKTEGRYEDATLEICLNCGSRPGQTNDIKIGICCFSAKHAASRSKSKDWSARSQYNVSE